MERKGHKMKKIFALILSISMLALAGCDKTGNSSSTGEAVLTTPATTTASTESVAEATTTEATEPQLSDIRNPLTGAYGYNEAAVGKRPLAVMINNIKQALPQYGIEQADMLYEVVVEGGITRMMAVYADYSNLDDICSVRSCRYYYPILAYGMDAIYCHWGSDQTIALETLSRLGIDHIDGGGNGNGTLFFKDKERLKTYSTEHTGYLKGSAVADTLSKLNIRTDADASHKGMIFTFTGKGETAVPVGSACSNANLTFSQSYFSTFTYDTATQTYLKQHSGSPHVDQRTGNQLAFTNVFALQTSVNLLGTGKLMQVELNGGSGYYISKGVAQPIKWSKPSEASPIKITDTSGKEIIVNEGKSYIGILGTGNTVSLS